MPNGVELATAYVTLKVDGSQVDSGVRRSLTGAQRAAGQAGTSGGKVFGTGFSKALLRGGAALGIGAIIKQSSQLEQKFGRTMQLVAASTGAPKTQIQGLTDLAMKLGAQTSFSANEAADAMLELGKSGISTSDIMGGALSGTLLLATAGQTSLATASTIASNAMNTFNLRGKDMGQIAAALAGGANASSASVESLGQALSQVGPGAKNAGLSLQDTVGVLSAFDAAGIKGSDAGTSLKTMLTRLVPQTTKAKDAMAALGLKFTDAQGRFLPITQVAQQLQTHLKGLSQEQRTTALATIFGSDATRAATVLMNQGAEGLGKYIKATKDQNAAQKMAKASMSGTAGAMERLRGSVETAELALGRTLAPTIVKTANFLSEKAVPAATDFIQEMQSGQGAGGEFAASMGSLVDVGRDLLPVLHSAVPIAAAFASVAAKMPTGLIATTVAMSKLSSLTGGSAGLGGFITQLRSAETRTAALGSAARSIAGGGGLLLLADGMQQGNKAAGAFETTLGGVAAGAAVGGPWGAAIGGLGGLFLGLSRDTDTANSAASRYAGTLDAVSAKITEQTRAAALKSLTSDRESSGYELAKQLGIPDRQLVDAATGNANAMIAIQRKLHLATGVPPEAENVLLNFLKKQRGELGLTQQQMLHNIAVNRTYSAAIKTLPKAVQTDIKTNGLEPTRKAIVDLTRKYHLTPKSIATLIRENGGRPTKQMIDGIIASAKNLGRQHPNPKIDVRDAASGVIRSANHLLDIFNGRHSTATIEIQRRYTGNNGPGSAGQVKKRAGGGPVRAGEAYEVGEIRRELFVPDQSGRMIANPASAGGTPGPINLTLVDHDGVLIGTMTGVADERYYANGALENR